MNIEIMTTRYTLTLQAKGVPILIVPPLTCNEDDIPVEIHGSTGAYSDFRHLDGNAEDSEENPVSCPGVSLLEESLTKWKVQSKLKLTRDYLELFSKGVLPVESPISFLFQKTSECIDNL